MGKKVLAVIGAVISTVYILNPTFGAFELLPDALPVVGNLDEATATAILIWAITTLFGKEDIKKVEEVLDKKKNKN